MSASDLVQVFQSLGRPRVLVLGDMILDRYTVGNAERISPEAPVVVLRAVSREARPGGAANVVNMLRALEAEVTAVGVVGDDASGAELRQLLCDTGADCQALVSDRGRPTSVKERFVGRAASRHPSQILRVDHESNEPLSAGLEAQLIEQLARRVPAHDALLISDYAKGACTPRVLRAAIEAASRAGVPVIVDPARSVSFEDYRGATLIKPNRFETELATGLKIASPADALAAGQRLCRQLGAQMALVTLDRDGMILVEPDGSGAEFPTHARDVYDITGAGDMVLAMIGLCLAAGLRPADAARLGNVAAGLEVERSGVAVIYRDEILAELNTQRDGSNKLSQLEQVVEQLAARRRRGEKIVFTNGCFDLLHVGHVTYLAEAAALGDVLVVGVNSDASVRRLKGSARPVIGEADRAAMLAALACVDHVVIFPEDTPQALIEAIRPDVLVKGGTYQAEQIVGYDFVTSYGGKVCIAGLVEGISTTHILSSLAKSQAAAAVPAIAASDERPAHLRRAG